MDAPKEVFLKDYKKPDYLFESVHMNIVILLWKISKIMFLGHLIIVVN